MKIIDEITSRKILGLLPGQATTRAPLPPPKCKTCNDTGRISDPNLFGAWLICRACRP